MYFYFLNIFAHCFISVEPSLFDLSLLVFEQTNTCSITQVVSIYRMLQLLRKEKINDDNNNDDNTDDDDNNNNSNNDDSNGNTDKKIRILMMVIYIFVIVNNSLVLYNASLG